MNELKDLIIRNRKPLIAAALVVLAVCWFLGSSFLSLIHNKMEYNRLSKETVELDKQHEELQKRLALLKKQDASYLERVARVKYNMSKNGETEFRFDTGK